MKGGPRSASRTRRFLSDAYAGFEVGSTLAVPGQAPVYVSTLSRLLAAALLVVGGIEALRNRHPRPGVPFLAGSILAALVILALLVAPAGALPSLGSGLPSIPDAMSYRSLDVAAANDRLVVVGWAEVSGADVRRNFSYVSPPPGSFVAPTDLPSPTPT